MLIWSTILFWILIRCSKKIFVIIVDAYKEQFAILTTQNKKLDYNKAFQKQESAISQRESSMATLVQSLEI